MSIEIPFSDNWAKVAIAISGGADSALLAYMVCSLATAENFEVHVINNIRCWKTKPWQQHDANRVINWLIQRFPNITFKVHTNFVPPELEWGNVGRIITDEYGKLVSGDTLELRAFAEYVCFIENVNAYYNGVTRNPRGKDFNGIPTREIEPTSDNEHLKITTHMGKVVLHPFRFIEKKEIISKYKELELTELLNLTRSCEADFPELNYTNYIPGQEVPVCGKCFWCKEREWAIEQSK